MSTTTLRMKYRLPPIEPTLSAPGEEPFDRDRNKRRKKQEESKYKLEIDLSEPELYWPKTQNRIVVKKWSSDESQLRLRQYPSIFQRIDNEDKRKADEVAKAAQRKKEKDRGKPKVLSMAEKVELENKEAGITRSRNTAKFYRPTSYYKKHKLALALSLGMYGKQEDEVTEIMPWLLLGTRNYAMDPSAMITEGITHILNVTPDTSNLNENAFVYRNIPIHDITDEDPSPYFDQAVKFLRHVKEIKGKVLVHCQAGASRAPTMVMAYLITDYDITLNDAFRYICARRIKVKPNKRFMYELAMYEYRVSDGGSSILDHPDWESYELNVFRAKVPEELPRKGLYNTAMTLYNS
jgi:protein-tyrosine phosphatase